jgi:hypothetical protein
MPTNGRKADILGMPYGTAGNRLRKLIMFHLLERHGENVCFKCKRPIETVEELSIEHVQRISKPGSGLKLRKVGPEGTAWCNCCKDILPVERFHKNRANWNGYSNRCISCIREPPSR